MREIIILVLKAIALLIELLIEIFKFINNRHNGPRKH